METCENIREILQRRNKCRLFYVILYKTKASADTKTNIRLMFLKFISSLLTQYKNLKQLNLNKTDSTIRFA